MSLTYKYSKWSNVVSYADYLVQYYTTLHTARVLADGGTIWNSNKVKDQFSFYIGQGIFPKLDAIAKVFGYKASGSKIVKIYSSRADGLGDVNFTAGSFNPDLTFAGDGSPIVTYGTYLGEGYSGNLGINWQNDARESMSVAKRTSTTFVDSRVGLISNRPQVGGGGWFTLGMTSSLLIEQERQTPGYASFMNTPYAQTRSIFGDATIPVAGGKTKYIGYFNSEEIEQTVTDVITYGGSVTSAVTIGTWGFYGQLWGGEIESSVILPVYLTPTQRTAWKAFLLGL